VFRYNETTTHQLSEAAIGTAVISVGATEQCGPYLPFHIDTLVADYFAEHWGARLNAYVLPTLPFNTSEEHSAFKGTLSLSPAAVFTVLEEIVRGLSRQGFRRQVLVGGHGGAYWTGAIIKHINHACDDIVLVNAHTGAGPRWEAALQAAGLADRSEVHGGMVSACLAAFLCPEMPPPQAFGTEIDPAMNGFMDYGVWKTIAADGSWGILRESELAADFREKGRVLLETFVKLQGEALGPHLAEACRLKGIPVE
jgi:creatinine amidohydrolase